MASEPELSLWQSAELPGGRVPARFPNSWSPGVIEGYAETKPTSPYDVLPFSSFGYLGASPDPHHHLRFSPNIKAVSASPLRVKTRPLLSKVRSEKRL
jgi:hypothetical protein